MNNEENHFSDEFLNAFVDDQLDTEEKSRVYLEIGRDETLNRRVCELRKLRDLVQHAYLNPPAPPARVHAGARARRFNLRFGVAASFLLVLGALLGSQLKLQFPALTPTAALDTKPAPAITKQNATATERVKPVAQRLTAATAPSALSTASPLPASHVVYSNQPSKVLIHIARDEASQLGEALNEVESLLRHYRDTRQNARVEVVINGKGLELVRIDTSAFAERIQKLQSEFDNLTFAACQNTIDRLKREQGIIVRLLPGVVVIDSGMAELMRRQNQGWAYIQV